MSESLYRRYIWALANWKPIWYYQIFNIWIASEVGSGRRIKDQARIQI